MNALRFPRLTRLLVLFALIQSIAPTIATITDAWRLDQRAPYAHVESETGSGCVLVHQHDCVLCAVATTPSLDPPVRELVVPDRVALAALPTALHIPLASAVLRPASQRAPPSVRG